jgi:hypothetical protein
MSGESNDPKLKGAIAERVFCSVLAGFSMLALVIARATLEIREWSDLFERLPPTVNLSILLCGVWLGMWVMAAWLKLKKRFHLIPLLLLVLWQSSVWCLQSRGISVDAWMKSFALKHSTDIHAGTVPAGGSVSTPKATDRQTTVAQSEGKKSEALLEVAKAPPVSAPVKPSPPPLEKVPYEGKDTKSLSIEDD